MDPMRLSFMVKLQMLFWLIESFFMLSKNPRKFFHRIVFTYTMMNTTMERTYCRMHMICVMVERFHVLENNHYYFLLYF